MNNCKTNFNRFSHLGYYPNPFVLDQIVIVVVSDIKLLLDALSEEDLSLLPILSVFRSGRWPGLAIDISFILVSFDNIFTILDIWGRSEAVSCTHSKPILNTSTTSSFENSSSSEGSTSRRRLLALCSFHAWITNLY